MGGCASGTDDKKTNADPAKADAKLNPDSKNTAAGSKNSAAEQSKKAPAPSMLDEFPEELPGESINPKRRVQVS